MYTHAMVGSNDIARSRRFYDALFGAMGAGPAREDDRGRLIYLHKDSMFLVTIPIDGRPATRANGGTLGFSADSPAQVDAWHRAGVEHGGTSVEDAPGVRTSMIGDLYLAYLRDPDGNKLCAMHRIPPPA